MESFITIMGGLAILVILGISGAVVYGLLLKRKPGKGTKEPVVVGIQKCPICGGKMESLRGAPHIIRCNNPKCPNYQDSI